MDYNLEGKVMISIHKYTELCMYYCMFHLVENTNGRDHINSVFFYLFAVIDPHTSL